MPETLDAELRALERMSVAELQQRYQEVLGESTRAHHLPQDQQGESRGRAVQVELLNAAMLAAGGLRTTMDERPDVVVDANGTQVGVACKRISAAAQFEKRVRDAGSQIGRSGRLGLILIELGPAMQATRPLAPFDDPSEVIDTLSGIGRELIARYGAEMERWIDPVQVAGIIVTSTIVGWAKAGGPATFRYSTAHAFGQPRYAPRLAQLRQIELAFRSGLAVLSNADVRDR